MNYPHNCCPKSVSRLAVCLATIAPVVGGIPAVAATHRKAHFASKATTFPVQRVMPHGAFLRRPVRTASELLQQVKTDPIVSQRYSRLLNMSPQMVRLAFGNMRLTELKTEVVRKIYYVHPGEQIGYRVRRIKKGERVFSYPDGTPIMLQVCGNAVKNADVIVGRMAAPKIKYFSPTEDTVAASTQAASYYPLRNSAPETELTAASPSDFVVESEAAPFTRPAPIFHADRPKAQLTKDSSRSLLSWVGGAALVTSLAGAHFSEGSRESSSGLRPEIIITTTTGGSNNGSNGTNNGGNGGVVTNGGGGIDNGGNNNGGNNATNDHSLVPESNSLLLLAFAGAGCLGLTALRRRLARQAS